MEELVAELGAAFLCADLDLPLEPREDHADYIANLAGRSHGRQPRDLRRGQPAQRAADFINGLQPASAG